MRANKVEIIAASVHEAAAAIKAVCGTFSSLPIDEDDFVFLLIDFADQEDREGERARVARLNQILDEAMGESSWPAAKFEGGDRVGTVITPTSGTRISVDRPREGSGYRILADFGEGGSEYRLIDILQRAESRGIRARAFSAGKEIPREDLLAGLIAYEEEQIERCSRPLSEPIAGRREMEEFKRATELSWHIKRLAFYNSLR